MNIASELSDLLVDIDSLKPREDNPRQGSIEVIKESLEINGQYRPIVVNKQTDEILAGNHTWKAAKELGWAQIAATWVDASEEEAARIVLVDNRANDVATYDNETLLKLLSSLDDLKGTGFSTDSVSDLLRDVGTEAITEGETDPDDIPEEPEPDDVKTKTGDIWQLGPHRLICGDSTDQAVIEKLMDGRKADLLLTDPPYGVGYGDKNKELNKVFGGNRIEKQIADDDLTGERLEDFLTKAFAAASPVLEKGNPYYCFLADFTFVEFVRALTKNGLSYRQVLIWVKKSFVIGRKDYQTQHEPILYGWKEGAAHKWYGAFNKSTVINHDRPHKSGLHPTTKPVGLLEPLIQNSSQIGDAVIDIFAGSGSTLIACERTGRHGYMCELDPAYCDVIVKRWEEHTGKTAELLSE